MILAPLYEVHTASDGEEALRLLGDKDIDLVTTDLRRPGLSGIEFLKEIKRYWPKMEVIIITAYATLADAKEAIRFGARDFISKPFRPQEVISVVEKTFQMQNLKDTIHNS